VLTSQNPRILIKFKDFLDGDPPPLLLGMVHLFCTVPNFLQAVPTRDTENQQVVYRTRGVSFPRLQEYLTVQYSCIFMISEILGIPHMGITSGGVSFFPQVAGIVE
jgi:hypothetical protein